MEPASDADVMVASLAEPAAFGEIYDRHAPALLRFLNRRLGEEVAEGVLGDLFRVAFEGRALFDADRKSAAPWLYGIAANLVKKHRRSEARRLRATARLAEIRSGGEPGRDLLDALDARSFWPRLADALADLPDGERDALLLYAWEEQSYEQVAAALAVPVGTVRSRIHRARERLRHATAAGAPAADETAGAPAGGTR